MKRITKLIVVLLCTALLLGLSACASDVDTRSKVQEEGVLTMGTNAEFPPFEFRDANGDVVGFDFSVAGMTVTEDRLENADFSDAYFNSSQVIIVKVDNETIQGSADLTGMTIGVQEGTTGDLEASEVDGATVMRFKKGIDAVVELRNGKVDAVVIDALSAQVFVEKNDDIIVLGENFTEEEYAIAVRKDETALLAEINKVIAELKENGCYQEIYDEYIGE